MTPQTHRKRLKRFEIAGQGRYLTFSCYQRLALFDNDAIKVRFVQQFARAQSRGAFRLVAWVVMPNHVHLLLIPSLPDWPVPRILNAIKRPFAQQVIRRWREQGAPILLRLHDSTGVTRFWQRGGGYDRNIVSDDELWEKIEYIHANPVRGKMVDRPTDWRWSSARWYAGQRDCVPVINPF